MNNMDSLMTLLDAWNLSEKGGDASQAIERQEKRGQAEVVRTKRLPKKSIAISFLMKSTLKE